MALQEYNVKKAGYYIIVSAIRIFGITEGSLPTVADAHPINTIEIFTNDPISSSPYLSEFSWVTTVSIEKLRAGKNNKYFRVPNIHTDNFDVRTRLYWLGKS